MAHTIYCIYCIRHSGRSDASGFLVHVAHVIATCTAFCRRSTFSVVDLALDWVSSVHPSDFLNAVNPRGPNSFLKSTCNVPFSTV